MSHQSRDMPWKARDEPCIGRKLIRHQKRARRSSSPRVGWWRYRTRDSDVNSYSFDVASAGCSALRSGWLHAPPTTSAAISVEIPSHRQEGNIRPKWTMKTFRSPFSSKCLRRTRLARATVRSGPLAPAFLFLATDRCRLQQDIRNPALLPPLALVQVLDHMFSRPLQDGTGARLRRTVHAKHASLARRRGRVGRDAALVIAAPDSRGPGVVGWEWKRGRRAPGVRCGEILRRRRGGWCGESEWEREREKWRR